MGEGVARHLVAGPDDRAQEILLRLRVAADREQDARNAELVEHLEQPREGGAVDQVARRQTVEAVPLEVPVDGVEIAGEDRVAHATARFGDRLPTAARTAPAMNATCSSV